MEERFTLTADPSLAYHEWANAGGGLQGPARLPLASPFADSVNLLKFAFNLSAAAGDSRILTPASGTAGLPAITRYPSGRLVIEFFRRRAATHPGLTYEVQTGSDLAAPSLPSLNDALITPIDPTSERVIVTDPVISPRRFGRVVVNQN